MRWIVVSPNEPNELPPAVVSNVAFKLSMRKASEGVDSSLLLCRVAVNDFAQSGPAKKARLNNLDN